MPIPQTIKIDPKDLQSNVALGVSLPFNGSSVFNSTYSTKQQAKFKFINLLLTNKGERLFNPEFGVDLRRKLFNPLLKNSFDDIKQDILDQASTFVPEILVNDVEITDYPDEKKIIISISYSMKLSGDPDQITINFE